MFDIQSYTSFLAAILVFQLVPGAGTLAILNATARNGVGAGLGAVLGTLAGDFLFMVAAVAGLAAIMNSNPILFQVLQWFGAAYLCWLGLQLLRSPGSQNATNPGPASSGLTGNVRQRQRTVRRAGSKQLSPTLAGPTSTRSTSCSRTWRRCCRS